MIAEGSCAPDFLLPGSGKSSYKVFNLKEAVESQNLLLMFCSSDILEEPMDYRPLEYAPWFQLLQDMNVWIVADGGLSSEVNQTIYPLKSVSILLDRHDIVANQYEVRSDGQAAQESTIAAVIIDETRTVRLSRMFDAGSVSEIKQVLRDSKSSNHYSNMKA